MPPENAGGKQAPPQPMVDPPVPRAVSGTLPQYRAGCRHTNYHNIVILSIIRDRQDSGTYLRLEDNPHARCTRLGTIGRWRNDNRPQDVDKRGCAGRPRPRRSRDCVRNKVTWCRSSSCSWRLAVRVVSARLYCCARPRISGSCRICSRRQMPMDQSSAAAFLAGPAIRGGGLLPAGPGQENPRSPMRTRARGAVRRPVASYRRQPRCSSKVRGARTAISRPLAPDLSSTREEALALRDWAAREKVRSVIVPTEIFAARRLRWMLHRVSGMT